MKRSGRTCIQAVAPQKPAPEKTASRVLAVNKKAKPGLSECALTVPAKKLSEEDERLDSALARMKKSSGIKAESVADRLLMQAASATLRQWSPKDITPGQRLELAINALAEMEPSNATEAMLAIQMIAVNDAALFFLSQATLPATTEPQRDDNTERACKLLALYIQQVDAMQRLKGKTGRQKVIVEHVHVHEGGQAIVGAVSSTSTGGRPGDDAENRGNTP